MNVRIHTLTVAILVVLSASGGLLADDGAWMPLFDGKSLDGWQVKGGFAEYRIEDGAILGTTVKGSPNTFLCAPKQYADFELIFEVKVDTVLNSGVQIRSHVYKKDTELTIYRDGRPVRNVRKAGTVYGYQVEIAKAAGGASGGIWDEARKAMWLFDAKTRPEAGKAMKENQWNEFRVLCVGDHIQTWINGVPCADFRDSTDLSGLIGLQVHSFSGDKPAQVRWRNLVIREIGHHSWSPLFDGKTLTGWHTLPGGTWKVENGEIIGLSEKTESRHGLLVTDKRFKDFTIGLKFKALKGNSGLYFRCDEVSGGVGVHGFQAEIDANIDVGGLYETGGRAWVVQPAPEDVKKWFKPGQWNEMTVSAHSGWIVVHVNGYKTAELKDDPGRSEGHIALQMHGGQDMDVHFKDIAILTETLKRL